MSVNPQLALFRRMKLFLEGSLYIARPSLAPARAEGGRGDRRKGRDSEGVGGGDGCGGGGGGARGGGVGGGGINRQETRHIHAAGQCDVSGGGEGNGSGRAGGDVGVGSEGNGSVRAVDREVWGGEGQLAEGQAPSELMQRIRELVSLLKGGGGGGL